VEALAAELADRFGPPPDPVLALLELKRIRLLGRRLGLTAVAVRGGEAYLETERGLLRDPRGRLHRLKADDGLGQLRELRALLEKAYKAL
jgi:transcription-repair coupling factor (superfamily II helicase)